MEKEKNEMSLKELLAKCKGFKIVVCDDAENAHYENGKVIENIDGEIKETNLNEKNFQDK